MAGKGKPGRRKKDAAIDEERIYELALHGNPDSDIAILADLSEASLKAKYSPVLKKARSFRRDSLRAKQYELALKGDKTMLVWLGKNDLGQADKTEVRQQVTMKMYGEKGITDLV